MLVINCAIPITQCCKQRTVLEISCQFMKAQCDSPVLCWLLCLSPILSIVGALIALSAKITGGQRQVYDVYILWLVKGDKVMLNSEKLEPVALSIVKL